MAIDGPRTTGLNRWQLIATDNLSRSRRRLTYKLTDGSERSTVIDQAQDSNDTRTKIGDALEADTRRLIRNNRTIEG